MGRLERMFIAYTKYDPPEQLKTDQRILAGGEIFFASQTAATITASVPEFIYEDPKPARIIIFSAAALLGLATTYALDTFRRATIRLEEASEKRQQWRMKARGQQ